MSAASPRAPHADERKQSILGLLARRGFVTFRELEQEVAASPATLRRDLERLAEENLLVRVHGGARLNEPSPVGVREAGLAGVPFQENITKRAGEKLAIGRAAAALCSPCLLYTSPSPRDYAASRMPSSA